MCKIGPTKKCEIEQVQDVGLGHCFRQKESAKLDKNKKIKLCSLKQNYKLKALFHPCNAMGKFFYSEMPQFPQKCLQQLLHM